MSGRTNLARTYTRFLSSHAHQGLQLPSVKDAGGEAAGEDVKAGEDAGGDWGGCEEAGEEAGVEPATEQVVEQLGQAEGGQAEGGQCEEGERLDQAGVEPSGRIQAEGLPVYGRMVESMLAESMLATPQKVETKKEVVTEETKKEVVTEEVVKVEAKKEVVTDAALTTDQALTSVQIDEIERAFSGWFQTEAILMSDQAICLDMASVTTHFGLYLHEHYIGGITSPMSASMRAQLKVVLQDAGYTEARVVCAHPTLQGGTLHRRVWQATGVGGQRR
eukprot:1068457-Amphidinium_carterae.1